MLIPLHPQHPQPRNVRSVVECLGRGGVIIYPTDTVYAFGCDIFQPRAVERICRLKGVDPEKARLSIICSDLGDLSRYARAIDTPYFRILKRHVPGPFTFILPASREVPRILKGRKDTIGLRVPDHPIPLHIIRELGHPILSSSLPGEMIEEYTDPECIHDRFGKLVDMVVDGGIGGFHYSTMVDLTGDEPTVIRQGMGEFIP